MALPANISVEERIGIYSSKKKQKQPSATTGKLEKQDEQAASD